MQLLFVTVAYKEEKIIEVINISNSYLDVKKYLSYQRKTYYYYFNHFATSICYKNRYKKHHKIFYVEYTLCINLHKIDKVSEFVKSSSLIYWK